MPSSVIQNLGFDVSGLVEHHCGNILNLSNFKDPVFHTTEDKNLLLVNRALFDEGLIKEALQIGKGRIELQQSFLVGKVEESQELVRITSQNNDIIDAKILIAGDGVHSKTARSLGLAKNRQTAAAIDAEVTVTPRLYRQESDRLTFNFHCLPAGYGWIFPKREGVLSCGVGSWKPDRPIKQCLNDFLEKSLPEKDVLHVSQKGYPIPIWPGISDIATPRVALVGDAANLVDPVSGEGIRYAILSGKLAAETARVAVETNFENSRGMLAYPKKIHSVVGTRFDFKRKFLFLALTQAPEYFYRQAIKSANGYNEAIQ